MCDLLTTLLNQTEYNAASDIMNFIINNFEPVVWNYQLDHQVIQKTHNRTYIKLFLVIIFLLYLRSNILITHCMDFVSN